MSIYNRGIEDYGVKSQGVRVRGLGVKGVIFMIILINNSMNSLSRRGCLRSWVRRACRAGLLISIHVMGGMVRGLRVMSICNRGGMRIRGLRSKGCLRSWARRACRAGLLMSNRRYGLEG
jgi:hypothetical protein